jgi:hypothetical protein
MAAAREGRVLPGLFHFGPVKAGCLAAAAALWERAKSHMLAGIWLFFGIRQSSGWDDNAYLAH